MYFTTIPYLQIQDTRKFMKNEYSIAFEVYTNEPRHTQIAIRRSYCVMQIYQIAYLYGRFFVRMRLQSLTVPLKSKNNFRPCLSSLSYTGTPHNTAISMTANTCINKVVNVLTKDVIHKLIEN